MLAALFAACLLPIDSDAQMYGELGQITATDPDRGDLLRNWQIKGGTGAGLFAIDRDTGRLTVADSARVSAAPRRRYSLIVTVSDGRITSSDALVTIDLR